MAFQFTGQNIWDYGYDKDLMPLAGQTGMDRDALSQQRDAFIQPWESKYRDAMAGQGQQVNATSADLFYDQGFRSYVQGGSLPANASPAQQWNAQPPLAQPPAAQPLPAPLAQPTPFASSGNDLIQLLMQRAQNPTVDRTNPNVRAQADAYSAQQDRASRNYLSDMAEREGPFANLDGYRRMAAERAGQASGAFEAELMARELVAQRDMAGQALGMWGGLYSGDQGLNLSREMGYLGNDQRTADRNTQMDQFLRELALREFDTNNRWDYNWLMGGL